MGTYDEDWAKLDKRLPLDLAFGAQAILIHNILTYPVYKERKRVENQEQQQENSKTLLILSSKLFSTIKIFLQSMNHKLEKETCQKVWKTS